MSSLTSYQQDRRFAVFEQRVWDASETSEILRPDSDVFRTLIYALRLAGLKHIRDSDGERHSLDAVLSEYRSKISKYLLSVMRENGSIDPELIPDLVEPMRSTLVETITVVIETLGHRVTKERFVEVLAQRPLALVLGGGGGTGFVFLSVLNALEELGIRPRLLVGTSMGAILGMFRSQREAWSTSKLDHILDGLRLTDIVAPIPNVPRFGFPGSFELRLRKALSHYVQHDGQPLRFQDTNIPFRVVAAGVTDKKVLDDYKVTPFKLQTRGSSFALAKTARIWLQRILKVANLPVKSVVIGGHRNDAEIEVIDAVGFSAAVPGVLHYDIDNPTLGRAEGWHALFERESVFGLFDGGVVNNLPAQTALSAFRDEDLPDGVPYVLGLNSFGAQMKGHWPFKALALMAHESGRTGGQLCDTQISFSRVLSPLNLVPNLPELRQAMRWGEIQAADSMRKLARDLQPVMTPRCFRQIASNS